MCELYATLTLDDRIEATAAMLFASWACLLRMGLCQSVAITLRSDSVHTKMLLSSQHTAMMAPPMKMTMMATRTPTPTRTQTRITITTMITLTLMAVAAVVRVVRSSSRRASCVMSNVQLLMPESD